MKATEKLICIALAALVVLGTAMNMCGGKDEGASKLEIATVGDSLDIK